MTRTAVFRIARDMPRDDKTGTAIDFEGIRATTAEYARLKNIVGIFANISRYVPSFRAARTLGKTPEPSGTPCKELM